MQVSNDPPQRPDRLLVVDDDLELSNMIATILETEGFEVTAVGDGKAALSAAVELRPDLILLDVMMPNVDGLEVCRRLRANSRTRYLCVILLTAKVGVEDKVEGLRAGADDYLTKPFDTEELVERVRSTLRRSRAMKNLNPLTGLPGNEQIRIQLRSRLTQRTPTALLHIDIDHFKAFNDHYGFLRGDEAIVLLGGCITDALSDVPSMEAFIGHIGGDDFVLLVNPDYAELACKMVVHNWTDRIRDLYDTEDLERDGIEVPDRRRRQRHFPILTLSIGIATNIYRPITSELEMADIATEMKQLAKRDEWSSWAVDRRKSPRTARDEAPMTETLLVVDDDEDFRLMVRMAMHDDFKIIEASDGMQAYLVAENCRPRWVLLDYRMPELNGRYAADLIREKVPEAGIIAFSGAIDTKPSWADGLVLKSEFGDMGRLRSKLRNLMSGESLLGDESSS